MQTVGTGSEPTIFKFMNMQVPINKNLLDISQLKVSNRYASTHNVMMFAHILIFKYNNLDSITSFRTLFIIQYSKEHNTQKLNLYLTSGKRTRGMYSVVSLKRAYLNQWTSGSSD